MFSSKNFKIKYSELERKLKKIGCYGTGEQMNEHPVWYNPSPKTNKKFKMSNHKEQEVKKRTLGKLF